MNTLTLTMSVPDERGQEFKLRNNEYKYHAFIPDRWNDQKEWHIYSNDKDVILVIQVMFGKITGSLVTTADEFNGTLFANPNGADIWRALQTEKMCFECKNSERYNVPADFQITGYDHDHKLPIKGCVCIDCINLYDDDWGKETKTCKEISYLAKTGNVVDYRITDIFFAGHHPLKMTSKDGKKAFVHVRAFDSSKDRDEWMEDVNNMRKYTVDKCPEGYTRKEMLNIAMHAGVIDEKEFKERA